MCLAIPGKVLEIFEKESLKMGRIDYEGIINEACLACVPEIEVGEYALVHAGFAIAIIDEEEAMKSYEVWKSMEEELTQMESNTVETGNST